MTRIDASAVYLRYVETGIKPTRRTFACLDGDRQCRCGLSVMVDEINPSDVTFYKLADDLGIHCEYARFFTIGFDGHWPGSHAFNTWPKLFGWIDGLYCWCRVRGLAEI